MANDVLSARVQEGGLIQEPAIKVVRVAFLIDDNGATGKLAHVELDRNLPEHYQIRDLLVAELAPAVGQTVIVMAADNSETTEGAQPVLEVWGIRSPASKFVTVKPMLLTPSALQAHRTMDALRDRPAQ